MALNNPVPLLSQFGNDPYALLLNALRSVRIQMQADQAMPQGAADRVSQLGSGALPSPGSTTEPTTAEKLDTIIDILVRNQLLYRKQDQIGLSLNINGDPSLASAGAVEMNGEQYDPVGFVSAVQTRAAAAELQIRQLTPPPVQQDAPGQDSLNNRHPGNKHLSTTFPSSKYLNKKTPGKTENSLRRARKPAATRGDGLANSSTAHG